MKRVFKVGLFGASALTLASCASLTGTETTADVVETAATDAVVEVVETVAEVETAIAKVDAELIPREMIFGNPTYSSVQISGDGSMISYLAPVEGVMNIWVAPSDDISAAKPITADTGRGIRGYGWLAGLNRLVYIQDKGGDENFLLYGVDPVSGEEINYTPFENTRVQLLASDEDIPGKQIVGINNRDPRWHDVYALDAETGELTLLYENVDQIGGYVFDNNLEMRFGQKSTSAGGAEYYTRTEDGWELFMEISPEDLYTTGLSGFSEDNSKLYMVESVGRDTGALFAMDMATGEKSLIAADD
ncbi:MAG: S9 family peptidase, partial [Pseudomonadota bacterium]